MRKQPFFTTDEQLAHEALEAERALLVEELRAAHKAAPEIAPATSTITVTNAANVVGAGGVMNVDTQNFTFNK